MVSRSKNEVRGKVRTFTNEGYSVFLDADRPQASTYDVIICGFVMARCDAVYVFEEAAT